MIKKNDLVERVQASGIPWSMDAEKAMLGSMLCDASCVEDFAYMRDGYFYYPSHGVIFGKMLDMRAADLPIDLVTLTETLSTAGVLESVGGAAAMGHLFTFVPSAANVEHYADIVKEKAARRLLMSVANELAKRARDEDVAPEQLLEDAFSKLMMLRNATGADGCWQHISGSIMAASDQIEATYRNRGQVQGLATGLNDFDRMTNGLRPGQLVIVAARPGMGKTCFCLQAARNFAEQGPVAMFSLEMNAVELASRLICSETPLNLARVRDGFLGKSDLPRLNSAITSLAKLGIYVDETPALSILDFRSRARQAVVKQGARAIFVDYLQLLRSTSRRAQENRALEVAEISMSLKACAKELKVPVIAAAQLNRDAEHRAGPPKLADLRESGQIEQDADIVLFLHRPKKDSKDPSEREEMQLIVAKHRDGPVNSINLRFVGEHARFQNVTEKLYSNNSEMRQDHNG